MKFRVLYLLLFCVLLSSCLTTSAPIGHFYNEVGKASKCKLVVSTTFARKRIYLSCPDNQVIDKAYVSSKLLTKGKGYVEMERDTLDREKTNNFIESVFMLDGSFYDEFKHDTINIRVFSGNEGTDMSFIASNRK